MAIVSRAVSFSFLALFGAILVRAVDEPFLPVQTNFGLDSPDIFGWTPAPTAAPYAAPHVYQRQDLSAPATCGYVNGNSSLPVTCGPAVPYCALATNVTAAGCCASRVTVNGKASLAGCQMYTKCYNLDDACDENCQSDPNAAHCTFSSNPFCATYMEKLFTYSQLFTSFGCLPTRRTAILTVLGAAVNGTNTANQTTSSSSSSSSSSSFSSASLSTTPLRSTTHSTSSAKTSSGAAARVGSSTYSAISTFNGLICMSLLIFTSGFFMLWL